MSLERTDDYFNTRADTVDIEIVKQWDDTGIIIAERDDCVGSVYGNLRRDKAYISGLLNFFRHEYDLEPAGITPAKRGYYGETWKVDTSTASYFMKLDYSKHHKHIYERSFTVIEWLHRHGIDYISRIVKTTDGRLFTTFDGAILGVFNWIDGENIQDKNTKIAEYQMLAQIYTVPYKRLTIPYENFSGSSADIFFDQWSKLDSEQVHSVLEKNRTKIEHRAQRLKYFAALCRDDASGLVITHGDAGGNIIVSGGKFYIVDWDDPILAPPERDAWFCLYWDWAMDAFNKELVKNGVDYTLRQERLAYYCYHSFFYYLTEYLSTYFDIGDRDGDMAQKLTGYFSCWIEEELKFADTIL